jgi:hypothetical protein
MKSCPGQVVVHRDGTVAYCTEDAAGRRCAGEDRPHRGGFFACRVVDGENCAYCTVDPLTLAPITDESLPPEPLTLAPITTAPG